MYGAIFSADRGAVDELLPRGLEPIRATPRRAAVTFLAVEYHRIGDDAMPPYDEFSVMFPAVETGARSWPLASLFTHGASGYVWYLPVTTEPAKALGVDIWGYPKEVAEIDHDAHVAGRRTTVSAEGRDVITLDVERAPAIDQVQEGASYTVEDGTLLREPLTLDGNLGAWPFSAQAEWTLGDHPRADRLRELDLGSRALARLWFDGEFVIGAGEPVGTV
ncbi:acetoacetate decarboxylase family protein [Halorientalis pallida]|uniref:acetoacetate decarboxylase family protein n=1 Tax=Halorientalis pallida TaxID=2479928 RepID=UPI001F26F6C9|nr:acetoacetate decarboxylase family protein [Halorientalis pallida]